MNRTRATAFAPASVGNVGVGFDLLGHVIEGPRDVATVQRIDEPTVRINAIRNSSVDLPLQAERNTASAGLIALREALHLPFGFAIDLQKGIAFGSGMGGSAASCVAALVAANALLESPLPRAELYPFALAGEAVASDSAQGDNVGPMLLGGLVLASKDRLVSVPVPPELHCVVVHPDTVLETRRARDALAGDYALPQFVVQSTHLALVLAGCYGNNMQLIRAGLDDVLVEPRRAPLIPGFVHVKQAALDQHALGCSISGAGPSVFAWFDGRDIAETAVASMCAGFTEAGLHSEAWLSPVAAPAAGLLD